MSQFQTKKEALLKTKVDLEEKLKKPEQGVTGWLEPCLEFLEAAHQADQPAAETLYFSCNLPWLHLAAAARRDNLWALPGSDQRPPACEVPIWRCFWWARQGLNL